ncbi:hypothetical protein [Atopomonas sediminilitoris]|uniref:hypothetical protein n=1 Tax=Atopomonas sediminilitoris TaxID=2919919 RepID=UPI001F4D677D|nr:hypothetical protein [Atopomonas sediminilitoris]MCJ8169575.1 hypothetical protein [Atopomonas sediminilitoris]
MRIKLSWRVWLWVAGLINIGGVLLFSQGLQSPVLGREQPEVLSLMGLLAIMLWGLAYIATALQKTPNRTLLAVFALEKLLYVGAWLSLMVGLPDWLMLWAEDPLATLFMAIYGPNDLLFCLIFAVLAVKASATPAQP